MRCNFVYNVTAPIGRNESLIPLEGIGITAWELNSDGTLGVQTVPFSQPSGDTPASSMATDANGNISFWFDPGDYLMKFSDQNLMPRIDDFTIGFSSVPWANVQAGTGGSTGGGGTGGGGTGGGGTGGGGTGGGGTGGGGTTNTIFGGTGVFGGDGNFGQ